MPAVGRRSRGKSSTGSPYPAGSNHLARLTEKYGGICGSTTKRPPVARQSWPASSGGTAMRTRTGASPEQDRSHTRSPPGFHTETRFRPPPAPDLAKVLRAAGVLTVELAGPQRRQRPRLPTPGVVRPTFPCPPFPCPPFSSRPEARGRFRTAAHRWQEIFVARGILSATMSA